jgi:hypothetical protein
MASTRLAPVNHQVAFLPGPDRSVPAADGRGRAIAMPNEHVLETFCEESAALAQTIDDSEEQG